MNLLDSIRVWILGDPIKVDSTKNVNEIFLEFLLSSGIFAALFVGLILFVLINLLFLINNKKKVRKEFYFYTSGCFLIFTALVYKFSYEVIFNTAKPGEGAVMFGFRKIGSALRVVDENLTNVFDSWFVDKKSKSSFLHQSAFNKLPEITYGKLTEEKPENNVQSNDIKNNVQSNDKENNIQSNNIENNIQSNDSEKNKEKKDKSLKSLKHKKEKLSVQKLTEKSTKSDENEKDDQKTKHFIKQNDEYMSKISKIIDIEKKANVEFKEKGSDITKSLERIKSDWKSFEKIFEQWYTEAHKIEEEMRSFNADIKNMPTVVKDMHSDIKSVLGLQETLHKLNKQATNDSDQNSGSSIKNDKQTNRQKQESKNSAIIFITIYFLFHGVFVCYFIVCLLCQMEIGFVSRCISFCCLTIDIFFGVYMLVYTQILDKICIVGEVEGCQKIFSNGFVAFANSAGLNLKNGGNNEKQKIEENINKIQVQTENIANELKDYLSDSKMVKFHLKAVVFLQTFNKIEFIKNEFTELTHSKVNKENFYEQIYEMKRLLENMSVVLENQLYTKMLLDTFAREISFLTFLRTEKDSLYKEINTHMNKSMSLNVLKNEECEVKKAHLCFLKSLSDKVSFLTLLGGIVFMLLFCIY
ncbi:hypothetical protein EHP00_220 [Ecytonucleospora hepatopenaei]|uniref:Uncharacterized protein n=1 Tax=Ecytonucleospora hepatopenaei TaxID=646526 RepID=A0A1W0E6G9_9MICR|nr:hypothetical protein EHP00_220 [Ecytonucleospora hepatopenaei]